MSHFDFPRIHVRGMIRFNVGTANNDDYAGEKLNGQPLRLADTDEVQPETWNKKDDDFKEWATNPVTADPVPGKDPEHYVPVEWNYYGDMGVALEFKDDKENTSQVKVASVQTGPSAFIEAPEELDKLPEEERQLLEPFLGATISFKKRPSDLPDKDDTFSTAIIIDCAQEGSSQSSQLFADNLLLVKDRGNGQFEQLLGRKLDNNGQYLGGGQPTKASTLWLNFQRNVNLSGPGGASGTFHSVMEFGDGVESSKLRALFDRYPSPSGRRVKGVVFRYNFFRVRAPYRDNLSKLSDLYKKQELNPGIGEIVGTLAPWFEDDACETHSLGRLLVPPRAYGFDKLFQLKSTDPGAFATPKSQGHNCKYGTRENPDAEDECQGNGSCFRLAPIVARVNPGPVLSLDVVNTFPEYYQKSSSPEDFHEFAYHDDTDPATTFNPKYNLGGPLKLMLTPSSSGSKPVQIATLDFDDGKADGSYGTAAYYKHGGMIDIPLSAQSYSGNLEEDLAEGRLSLVLGEDKQLLVESELMVIPNQPTLYTEQALGGTARTFNFNGTDVPSTLSIYKKGRPITATEYQELVQNGRGLVLQEFRLTPMQLVDDGTLNAPLATYKVDSPGYQLSTKVDTAFTKLLAVTWKGAEASQDELLQSQAQVDTLIHPLIYVRILPNEDFSQYYVNPHAAEPVGNDSLTFDVLYDKIFRNYYLLYPAMSHVKSLKNKEEWEGADVSRRLMTAIAPETWPTKAYMPRTRDLSSTRRTLLQAWARMFLGGTAAARAAQPGLATGGEDTATETGATPTPAKRAKIILR